MSLIKQIQDSQKSKSNQMKKLSLKFLTLVFMMALVTVGCNKDDEMIDPGPDPSGITFREVIEKGGTPSDPIEAESSEELDSYTEEVDGTIWECTTETVSIQDAAGGNDGFSLFSPNSNVIYPGNLLQGKTLNQGTPDIIAVKRAGGTISTDVVDGNIQSSFEVDEIAKSTVTDAINNIIAGSTGVLPANFNLKIENIQSREQFALSLGLDVNSTFVDVEAKLNYSSDTEKNTFMVNLNQSFYTMSFDIPTSLDELFDPSVTPADLQPYVGEGNPATYISDVTYGRIYYMMIESSSSITEMDAKINASFNGVATTVDAEIETSYLNELEELKISVFAYGGESGSALLTVGNTNISELASLLAQGSIIEAGKPISYVVRSVADNQIVSTQLATNYDVTNCEISGIAGALPALAHWTGNVNNMLGNVSAAYWDGNNKFILMNEQGQWLRSTYDNNGEGLLEGPYEWDGLIFNNVGATCRLTGPSDDLCVFNASGTQYSYYRSDGTWSDINQITDFFAGSCPFNAAGIGAITISSYKNYNSSNPDLPYGLGQYVFNSDGDKYSKSQYQSLTGDHFSDVFELYQWSVDNSVTDRIDGVGAATGYYLGDQITGDYYTILFNKSGTKYVVYGDVNGTGAEVIGPFDL